MNFTINVELDWLEDGEGLDEKLKEDIIKELTSKLSEKMLKKIEKQIEVLETKLTDEFKKNIELETKKVFKDITKKELHITNEYGEITRSNVTLENLVKEKFCNYMQEKVNGNGVSDKYGHHTRSNYMVEYLMGKKMFDFTNKTISDVENKMKEYLTDTLKIKIGDSIFKNLDIENIISRKSIENK